VRAHLGFAERKQVATGKADLAGGERVGGSRMMASEVADFPEPDSPTRPRTSPGAMLKLMPWTTGRGSAWVRKEMVRSRTSSRGATC